jgi:hypothetical protein
MSTVYYVTYLTGLYPLRPRRCRGLSAGGTLRVRLILWEVFAFFVFGLYDGCGWFLLDDVIDLPGKELGLKRTITLILVGVVFGVLAGYFGAMARYGHSVATFMLSSQEMEIIEFENSAVDAYYNEPTEAAVWALETYIGTLNRLKEERSSGGGENPYLFLRPDDALMCSHARLGQLYKKLDNSEKSKYHFEQAMSKRQETDRPPFGTEEELIAFVHNEDSAGKSRFEK